VAAVNTTRRIGFHIDHNTLQRQLMDDRGANGARRQMDRRKDRIDTSLQWTSRGTEKRVITTPSRVFVLSLRTKTTRFATLNPSQILNTLRFRPNLRQVFSLFQYITMVPAPTQPPNRAHTGRRTVTPRKRLQQLQVEKDRVMMSRPSNPHCSKFAHKMMSIELEVLRIKRRMEHPEEPTELAIVESPVVTQADGAMFYDDNVGWNLLVDHTAPGMDVDSSDDEDEDSVADDPAAADDDGAVVPAADVDSSDDEDEDSVADDPAAADDDGAVVPAADDGAVVPAADDGVADDPAAADDDGAVVPAADDGTVVPAADDGAVVPAAAAAAAAAAFVVMNKRNFRPMEAAGEVRIVTVAHVVTNESTARQLAMQQKACDELAVEHPDMVNQYTVKAGPILRAVMGGAHDRKAIGDALGHTGDSRPRNQYAVYCIKGLVDKGLLAERRTDDFYLTDRYLNA